MNIPFNLWGDGKEGKIAGRYMDKNVDIAILRNNQVLAGVGVKFMMQNYAQNANNYFENMLGETANIQCANVPYFQILIIPHQLPYYQKSGQFAKWEVFHEHHAQKYCILSVDNPAVLLHSSCKMLLYVIDLPNLSCQVDNKQEYEQYYLHLNEQEKLSLNVHYMPLSFSQGVIHNDYETFANKLIYRFLSE